MPVQVFLLVHNKTKYALKILFGIKDEVPISLKCSSKSYLYLANKEIENQKFFTKFFWLMKFTSQRRGVCNVWLSRPKFSEKFFIKLDCSFMK